MNYEESVAYIEGKNGLGKKVGLRNMRRLLARLGDPQDRFPSIHVAGTNGKGSVCACLSSILVTSGRSVGLYTSPYLQRYNERIRLNGSPIPDEILASITTRVRCQADEMERCGEGYPTVFELGTAVAYLFFAEMHVDVAVIEVGLGGRLDPTNVIYPEVSVIAHIGLDHVRLLGDTVEKIAWEKAGIVKLGRPTVLYPQLSSVAAVIKGVCGEKRSLFFDLKESEIAVIAASARSQSFSFRFGEEFFPSLTIPLAGQFQIDNAATAVAAVCVFRRRGFAVSDSAISEGLAKTVWPGRLEWIGEDILLDGGHNPQGSEALCRYLDAFVRDRRIAFVTGILRDKNPENMVPLLAKRACFAACVAPESHRASAPEDIAALFLNAGVPAEAFGSIPDAIREAKARAGEGGLVVICGSLYLVGAARTLLCGNLPA